MDYFWKKKAVLSLVAAMLVVIIHNTATAQYMGEPTELALMTARVHQFLAYRIGAVAVPFFFFASGVAMFRDYKPSLYKKKMKSRMRSLVVPYLIWNVVGMVVAIVYTYTPLAKVVGGRELFEPTVGNILSGVFLYKYNYHFWFLFNLIIYSAGAPVFDILMRRKWVGILVLVALLPLARFGGIVGSLPYYALGCFVGRYYWKEMGRKAPKRVAWAGGAVVLVAIVLDELGFGGTISLIATMLGLYVFADLFVEKVKPRAFFGESFPLYVIHPFIIAVVVKMFYRLGGQTPVMFLAAEIGSTVLTIIVALVILRVWHKKLPKLYAISFLGQVKESRRP